jgi:FAD/FMN-containing dehydrogenase
MADAELLGELGRAVGDDGVLTDPEVTSSYGTAWAARDGVVPAAVVLPRDVNEAAAVMRACAARGQAVVLQGGNTGMVRGGVPGSDDEIVVGSGRMGSIEEVDGESLSVVVGAGVTLGALQERLDGAELELPVDLASRSQATVGGMAATNAGGSRAFRHGTMRRRVLGVEAVLADGSVIERLGGVMKDATGYDWPSILVGSEGTLALITRLRLRLRPVERSRAAALVPVDSIAAGLALAVALRDRRCGLEAAEFVMPGALRLVCEELSLRPPFGAGDGGDVVLVECRAQEGAFDALIGALRDLAVSAEAVVTEGTDADGLWRYREGLGEALTHEEVVKLDVALPLSRLAEGLAALERAALDAGGASVRPYLFGHLLDGNVHVNIGAVPKERRGAVERAVLESVLAHGGSIGAEHGIGRAKVGWLAADRSAADIAAMRAVKAALDPVGLLNSGVLLPHPER